MQLLKSDYSLNLGASDVVSHENFLPMKFDQVGHKPTSNLIMHEILSDLANNFVPTAEVPIVFDMVSSFEEWQEVREARLRIYSEGSPYLKNLVNEFGADEYDANAFVFYARYKNRIIGTIRLNRFPFESEKYLDEAQLKDFLGDGWKDQYLEISRLAVDSNNGTPPGVSNALVVYSSLITACSTQYKFYLAYSHPKLKDRVFKFKQHSETIRFNIPGRRSIDYVLFKGVFWEDFSDLITNHGEHIFDSLRRQLLKAGMA